MEDHQNNTSPTSKNLLENHNKHLGSSFESEAGRESNMRPHLTPRESTKTRHFTDTIVKRLPPPVEPTIEHPFGIKSAASKFCQQSDLHGLNEFHEQFFVKRHKAEGVMWLTVFLLALTGLTYFLYGAALEFLDRPILTSENYVHLLDGIAFPTIYLCPTNAEKNYEQYRNIIDEEWRIKNVDGLLSYKPTEENGASENSFLLFDSMSLNDNLLGRQALRRDELDELIVFHRSDIECPAELSASSNATFEFVNLRPRFLPPTPIPGSGVPNSSTSPNNYITGDKMVLSCPDKHYMKFRIQPISFTFTALEEPPLFLETELTLPNGTVVLTKTIVPPPPPIELPVIDTTPKDEVHELSQVDAYCEEGRWKWNRETSATLNANDSNPRGRLVEFTDVYCVPEWTPASVEEYYLKVGRHKSEFIRECAFSNRRRDCQALVDENFNPDFGKCFSIQLSKDNVDERHMQRLPGVGLTLLLDMQFPHWSSPESQATSRDNPSSPLHTPYELVQLSVISEDKIPVVSHKSIHIRPGSVTKVSLESKTFSLLERSTNLPVWTGLAGRKRCLNEEEIMGNQESIFNYTFVEYTESTCQLDCIYRSVIEYCGCVSPIDRSMLKTVQQNVSICNGSSIQTCAYKRFQDKNQTTSCVANCLAPCQFRQWSITQSATDFPAKRFSSMDDSIINEIEDKQQQKEYIIYKEAAMNGDKILLQIALPTLSETHVQEEYSMTFNNFLGVIGGLFGLWLGPSLVTLFKTVYLLLKSTCHCRNSPRKQKKSSKELTSVATDRHEIALDNLQLTA